MSTATRFGCDRFGRDLFLLVIDSPEELPSRKPLSSKYFPSLIVWDAEGESVEIVKSVTGTLLDWGGINYDTWGSNCELVHDIIDLEIMDSQIPETDGSYIETRWHTGAPLEDALWNFLWLSEPAKDFEEGCDSGLVVAIGARPEVLAFLRTALGDPKKFCDEEVARDDPDD